MIDKVPKEELNALFEEIFNVNEGEYLVKENRFYRDNTVFYGYKLKHIFNSTLTNMSSIPLFINDFSVSTYEKNVKKSLIGLDIEKKFRVFFDVDETFVKNIDEYSKNDQLEDGYAFNFAKNIIENLADNFIKEINLKTEKLSYPYTHFYNDEILLFTYECYLEDKKSNLYVFIEKEFLDSGVLKNWIFSKPTSTEVIKINTLKSLINFDVEIVSKPISIDFSQKSIFLKDIRFKKLIK